MIPLPPLVDQHCHGILRTELGLGTFESRLAGTSAAPAPGTTFFDTQAGFAVRRWCPPLLGLEPHCPPVRYLARRRELGAPEVGRLLLRASGIGTYLVDTGGAAPTGPGAWAGGGPAEGGELTEPAELAEAGAADAHEIVRLERLAEQIADTSGTARDLISNLAEAVHGAAATAAGFAAAAGRGPGPALAPEPPGPGEVRWAAERWLAGRRAGEPVTDPVLVRHLLWTAVDTGRPLQLHPGGGDPALAAERGDPRPLTDFVRATAGLGTDLVLLHGYPYHRHTACLAQAFPHVYADLGPALGRTGARATAVLAEALELAPFGKLLFSTGGRALPELHLVAARLFQEALGRLLMEWVADGSWSRPDAERVAARIAAGNARRVYGLAGPSDGAGD
ncbi:amidohydrolase family protein [Streptomyces sp. URMC 123]|uniref:amidohydrolase family protein n=1 Tax=Streptomyces sp. URMC 123 TaxID=3423403 RepID=UPI003F1CACFE